MGERLAEAIDLASEKDFRLGGLTVSPSACQIAAVDEEAVRVEPRVMEVLVTFVRANGVTVTRDHLIETCWGGRAVTDDAVTRSLAKLRKVGEGHFRIETIPRVGFRLVVEPDSATPVEPGLPDTSVRSGNFITAVPNFLPVLVIGLTLLLFSVGVIFFRWPARANAGSWGVAVSNFKALSQDADSTALANASTTATIRYLLASGVTPVIAATSPSGKTTLVLDVRVFHQDGRFEISGSILSPSPEHPVWSFMFRRERPEGLDEEAGRMIAVVMSCVLDDIANHGAHMATILLPPVFGACDRTAGDGIAPARRVVAALPDSARAHSRLGYVLGLLSDSHDYDVPSITKEAESEARRALTINERDVVAYLVLGMRLGSTFRWVDREAALRRALSVDPSNIYAVEELLALYREVGRLGEARELAEKLSSSGNPNDFRGVVPLALLDAMTGRRGDVELALSKLQSLHPDRGRSVRDTISFWWGLPRTVESTESMPAPNSFTLLINDCLDAVKRWSAASGDALPAACNSMDYDWRVRLLARHGDTDAAFRMIEQGLPNSRGWTNFLFYPETASLRADPRFPALLDKLKLMAYWRATSSRPDVCDAGNAPGWCSRLLPSSSAK